MLIAWMGLAGCSVFAQVSNRQLDDPFSQLESSRAKPDSDLAIQFFSEGKFADSIAIAKVVDAKLGNFSVEEKWQELIVRAHMETGDYPSALTTLDGALERFPNSIRIRWIGSEVCRFNGQSDRAAKLLDEISELASKNSWLYRNVPNQIVLGKYFLSRNADAKEVLQTFFNPIKARNPSDADIVQAIGKLALGKHDYALAAENFAQAVELSPKDPEALYGLAQAFLPSDSAKANKALAAALAINPDHVGSLLLMVDQHISSENYDDAELKLKQVLKVNPRHPDAWSYRAVVAHLNNDPAREGECRLKALADWEGNPHVDHVIGRELSEKYRFQEGESYQRRSLVYDADYLPAKMQLAHDLLRLGQELEGWKLADEVFDADQYSVVAHNLVTLRDQISKFKTLQRDGFVVRMEAAESEIYGERVLDLLSRAKQSLCSKYESELETPIFVEIFPRQQDFAIRTFGLPGGSGFLGVCFGRVITMNSPAAQGSNLTSWESVLWHEFCHVVTLQKTKNKMPRWLSEGISVYEEQLADPAWGESLGVKYREMLLGEELTPVSQLSGAFLRPESPLHLQFAYYESSLVVEYLVESFGIKSLLKVLDDLSLGTPINDSLRRHCAPVEFIDKKFKEFATSRAGSLAPKANWDEVEPGPEASAEQWAAWNADHPDNLLGLLAEAKQLIKMENWETAANVLQQIVKLSPSLKQPYPPLARAYRELDQPEKELQTLERFAELEADSVELFTKLLEISSANGDWDKTKKYARRLLALNPLLSSPHRYISMAAEKTNDDQAIIESLRVLSIMDPLDAADVHFRLASALHRTNQLALAKRQVIMALEQAPRYRDAHALLLKIVEQQSQADDTPAQPPTQSINDVSDTQPNKESP